MARSLWKGSISFGLVNVPVTLFTATESHRVGFHELEKETHARIHHKRVSESTGKEVSWDDIESGYEVRKGEYVVLTDEELAAAAPRKSHTLDVEQFVPLADIDPVNWDQTYYVAPDGEAAGKAYGLLRQAMEKTGRVAVGRFVLRTKEYVACVRPMGNILVLHTMFFPDEVRKPADMDIAPPKVTVGKQEMALAEKLIDMLSGTWDPAAYKDTYSERLLEIIHQKDKGQEIAAPSEEKPAKIVDLMAALKASLSGKGGGQPAPKAEGKSSSKPEAESAAKPGAKRAPKHEAKRASKRASTKAPTSRTAARESKASGAATGARRAGTSTRGAGHGRAASR